MEEINALKRWMEKDFTELRHEVERLDRAVYGDSRERNGSGVVPLVRRIERHMEEMDEKLDALRLVTVRQSYLILLLAVVELILVLGIVGLAALIGSLL